MTADALTDVLIALPQERPATVVAFFGALGLCVGSFANVLIYRLPRYCLSIVKPGSHCPECKVPIRWHDNIPVVSWLILGARCRACKTKIPWRYPLVELLVGVVFAALAWRVLVAPPPSVATQGGLLSAAQPWALFALWACASVALLVASWIDAQMRIIPDVISVGGTVVVLALAPVVVSVHGFGVPRDMLRTPFLFSRALEPWLNAWLTTAALMAIAAIGLWLLGRIGILLAPKAAREAGGAMGMGDVKLVMLLAGLLGWPKLLMAFFVAVLAGAVIGMPKLIRKYRGQGAGDSAISFGPFLSFGAVVAMLFSAQVFEAVKWYLELYR